MPAFSKVSPTPSVVNSRMAWGNKVMPTPSSFSDRMRVTVAAVSRMYGPEPTGEVAISALSNDAGLATRPVSRSGRNRN